MGIEITSEPENFGVDGTTSKTLFGFHGARDLAMHVTMIPGSVCPSLAHQRPRRSAAWMRRFKVGSRDPAVLAPRARFCACEL